MTNNQKKSKLAKRNNFKFFALGSIALFSILVGARALAFSKLSLKNAVAPPSILGSEASSARALIAYDSQAIGQGGVSDAQNNIGTMSLEDRAKLTKDNVKNLQDSITSIAQKISLLTAGQNVTGPFKSELQDVQSMATQAASLENADASKNSKHGKKGSKILGFFKGSTRTAVQTAIGTDKLKAKAGSAPSKNSLVLYQSLVKI